jgi:hypothetical protein
METIHHRAVVARWEFEEETEYRPFSGYGHYSRDYVGASAFRGYSTIPHHIAVESREDGERNGRIFYGPRPEQIAARKVERQRVRGFFRMDARHAAVADVSVTNVVIRLPDLTPPQEWVARVRAKENGRERVAELVGAAT